MKLIALALLTTVAIAACSSGSSVTPTPAESPTPTPTPMLTATEAVQIAANSADTVGTWHADRYLPSCDAKERNAQGWVVQCGMVRAAYVDYSHVRAGVLVPESRFDNIVTYVVADDGSIVRTY